MYTISKPISEKEINNIAKCRLLLAILHLNLFELCEDENQKLLMSSIFLQILTILKVK